MKILWNIILFFCCFSTAYGQDLGTPSRWTPKKNSFYGGIEGVIFANNNTQFIAQPTSLTAGDKALEPAPALVAGYRIASRLNAEVGVYALPIATSYLYAREDDYLATSYINNYIYIPLRGVFQIVGIGHRLGLSVLAGGGPAFTDLSPGPYVSPNFTSVSIKTNPDGSTRTNTATQRVTQQRSSCAVFEAGVRGHFFIIPRLALNLTVRQLWSPVSSVRDIRLTIDTPSDHLTATMTTPLRGIATSLGVYYTF